VKFACRKALRSAINRIVNKFLMTGDMNKKKSGVHKKKSVKTPQNILFVEVVIMQSPRKSVKRLSQQLNLGTFSTYWIIREDVKLFL
jgi:hypothetical protein